MHLCRRKARYVGNDVTAIIRKRKVNCISLLNTSNHSVVRNISILLKGWSYGMQKYSTSRVVFRGSLMLCGVQKKATIHLEVLFIG
jgi:hypothetical protein